jgi:hypothetical protein
MLGCSVKMDQKNYQPIIIVPGICSVIHLLNVLFSTQDFVNYNMRKHKSCYQLYLFFFLNFGPIFFTKYVFC